MPACSDFCVGLASEQMLSVLPFREHSLLWKKTKYIWLINMQSWIRKSQGYLLSLCYSNTSLDIEQDVPGESSEECLFLLDSDTNNYHF